METENRIDNFIQDEENAEKDTVTHRQIKQFIHNKVKSEKLRQGLWEDKDRVEITNILEVDKMANYEKQRAKKALIKMNSIYFLGCKKLIREKLRIDWEERDPNLKGRRKMKRGKKNKELYGCIKSKYNKKKSITSGLKDRGSEATECELLKKEGKRLSAEKSKKRMKEKRREQSAKNKKKNKHHNEIEEKRDEIVRDELNTVARIEILNDEIRVNNQAIKVKRKRNIKEWLASANTEVIRKRKNREEKEEGKNKKSKINRRTKRKGKDIEMENNQDNREKN
jgi:hypothetical protein